VHYLFLMRRNLPAYERERGLPTLMLALILWLPWLLALEIDRSAWRHTAPQAAVTVALVGASIGLYTLMFLPLFYRFPRWIGARFGREEALRWQYAALLAGIATGPITVSIVVPRLLPWHLNLGLGLGMLAGVVALALMLWLMTRHFPESCNWIPLRCRR
jgi:hypothetical protein